MTYRDFIPRVAIPFGLLYLVAAYFSVGYYHPDEHYQILEFIALKLGKAQASQLAWEYGAQMRSWIQPGIGFGLAKLLESLGIASPLALATAWRLLSAALAWTGAYVLARVIPKWFSSILWQKRGCLVLFGLFYMPFLGARASSEAWASSGIAIALGLLASSGGRAGWIGLSGAVFGLVFHVRYQTGFLIAGVGAWAWWVGRFSRRTLMFGALGLLSTLALGFVVDRWGYGAWVFAPGNYFAQNILQGKANQWGTSPWWSYLTMAWVILIKPFGLWLLFSIFLSWVWFPRHLFTWASLPFVLVHFFIAHKELRFLFPLAHLAGLQCCLVAAEAERRWPWTHSKLVRAAVVLLVCINLGGLLGLSFMEARAPVSALYALYPKAVQGYTVAYTGDDPFDLGQGISASFYRPNPLRLRPVKSEAEYLARRGSDREVFYRTGYGFPSMNEVLNQRCKLLADRGIYRWFSAHEPRAAWKDRILGRNRYYQVFECPPSAP